MKSKLFGSVVVLVLIVALLATGCTDTTTPTTEPTTTQTSSQTTTQTSTQPQTTPAGEVIKLTFSDHNPADMPVSNALTAYAEYIEEQSEGRVQIDLIYGGALLKQTEVMRGVQEGLADAATYVMQKADGLHLNDAITLPFMGWPGRDETTQIYHDLLEKFPEMQDEWEGITYKNVAMMPPVHMHWVDHVVEKPEDVEGIKSFCTHAVMVESYEALGGVPVSLDVSDMYTSLERGVVEGVVNHMAVLHVFGALEIINSHTFFGEGGINMAPVGVIWSDESYNKLPEDIQQIVDDGSQVWYETFMQQEVGFMNMVMGKAQEQGNTFVELTPEQVEEWRDIVAPIVHEGWISEMEGMGLPGQEVYDELLSMIAEYNQ